MHLCLQAEAAGTCVSGAWEEGCPPVSPLGVPVSHICAQLASGMPAKFASCLWSHVPVPSAARSTLAKHSSPLRHEEQVESSKSPTVSPLGHVGGLALQLPSCCHGLGAPAWSLIADGDTGPSAREKG